MNFHSFSSYRRITFSVLKVKVYCCCWFFALELTSSSDVPGSTFLALYPEAHFRDGHGHHGINVFYGQAAAGGRLFFMLSGRVQHGHLLGVKPSLLCWALWARSAAKQRYTRTCARRAACCIWCALKQFIGAISIDGSKSWAPCGFQCTMGPEGYCLVHESTDELFSSTSPRFP